MMHTSRRNFLRISGAGLLATQTPSVLAGNLSGKSRIPNTDLPFQLGIASYTFREFSLEETITMTGRLGISKLTLKSMHLPLDLAPGRSNRRPPKWPRPELTSMAVELSI